MIDDFVWFGFSLSRSLQVVVIQDASYIVPPELLTTDAFALPASDIRNILQNSTKFMWTLEHHNECVEAIQRNVLGGSDEVSIYISLAITTNR